MGSVHFGPAARSRSIESWLIEYIYKDIYHNLFLKKINNLRSLNLILMEYIYTYIASYTNQWFTIIDT